MGERPDPTDEELAAIMAAVELTWPRSAVAADDGVGAVPPWRFSGRWWTRPVVSRRVRPW